MTLEKVSRSVFNPLGLFKTVEGVYTLCKLGSLKTIQRDEESREYSKYSFNIEVTSLINYLQSIGYSHECIVKVLEPLITVQAPTN